MGINAEYMGTASHSPTPDTDAANTMDHSGSDIRKSHAGSCCSGRGFCGSTEGSYCPLCHNDIVGKTLDGTNVPSASHTVLTGSPTVQVVKTPSSEDEREGATVCAEKTKKRNRCWLCEKKVGLTGFACRCGGLFCSAHRYSDEHQCTFDYRALAAREISTNNPVVVAEKVAKI